MHTLQTFTFQVGDETGDTHHVTVVRHAPGHLSAHCTCRNARDGRHCDHCLRLLSGDTSQLESDNEVEVEVLEWWVACLDLKRTIARVLQAQQAGVLPPTGVARVLEHWPDLTLDDSEAFGHEVRGIA